MNTKLYTFSLETMTSFANQAREVIVANAFTEGLISAETAKKLQEEYTIVVVERGMLGKLMDKFLGIDDKPTMQLLKVIPLPKTPQ